MSLLERIRDLASEVEGDWKAAQEHRELVDKAEKVQKEATKYVKDRVKELKSLEAQLGDRDDDEVKELGAEEGEVASTLQEIKGRLKDVKALKPMTGSLVVRLFLGHVNVRVHTRADRSTLRDEYNKFKDRTNILFTVMSLLGIATQYYLRFHYRYTAWIFSLIHVWLLYYYTSLALRENILRVNGSAIKQWWITHHCISAILSVVFLTWPESPVWWEFMDVFVFYFTYQAILQILQSWYQKRRHYSRRALGKAGGMDVASGETLTERASSSEWDLMLLVVVIFGAHIWQVANGVLLLRLLFVRLAPGANPWYEYREEAQAFLAGIMFVVLGVCNAVVTIVTLAEKRQRRKQRAAI
jgi:hypothetical protein